MDPSVCLMSAATPELAAAPWVVGGQLTVSPLPSVQVVGAARVRYFVKLLVVPEPSERWTTVIGLDGSVASGLSALIAGSSQVVIWACMILAMVSGLSCSSSTPLRLYDIVIGAATVGKKRIGPFQRAASSGLGSESEPAKSRVPAWSCLRPSDDPLLA